ncbi:hypothetical protein ACFOTA_02830 [Chitinophaga sp. GCM10012297]|uniref:Entericidin n=1 Tax=Chitinophaga chungangae TaxID=2821488 RepID=A0ABS3Y8X2_9BACT|nr:hypothetical protein [Chitinophaga chungangae]MBO9151125.1 hypothetical protein [Chitinophaga chungangae]
MKKFGFLALALGLFVAACNNAGTSGSGDSTNLDSAINNSVDTSTIAPVDTAAVVDSAVVAPADSAK